MEIKRDIRVSRRNRRRLAQEIEMRGEQNGSVVFGRKSLRFHANREMAHAKVHDLVAVFVSRRPIKQSQAGLIALS